MDNYKEPHLEINGKRVEIGDTIKTFRGEPGILKSIVVPHKAGSTGRVYVELDESESQWDSEFFPSVIGAEWVGRTDQ